MLKKGPFAYTFGKGAHLQKAILLHLAKRGPQTRNEISGELGVSTSNLYVSYRSLKEKNLVQAVETKTWRGREYDVVWLTRWGLARALYEGVDPQPIRETFRKYQSGKELEILEFLCDISETVDPQFIKIVFEGLEFAENQPDAIVEGVLSLFMGLKKYPSLITYFGDVIGFIEQAISEGRIDVPTSDDDMKIGPIFTRVLMIASKVLIREKLIEDN